jgi:hypothetical protein
MKASQRVVVVVVVVVAEYAPLIAREVERRIPETGYAYETVPPRLGR